MRRILILSPLILLLAGCQAAQSTFNTHGPAADRIAPLSWLMTIVFLIATMVMWGLIAWAVVSRKGTLGEHAPVDAGGGQGWIAIGGLLIPLIVLCVFFVLGLRLLASFPISAPLNERVLKPDILIIGHQWWWEVQYLDGPVSEHFTTANEIHIPANRPVTLELVSHDVIHAFWVPALHGKVDLIPGHPNFMQIEASQPGNYKGQCGEYCGAEHALMRLLVVAQTPDDYHAWVEQQLKPGVEPQTPDAIAGEQIFVNGACSMCHTVRGTIAGGRVAPDLTHIGSRQYIAANVYPNNTGNLEAWITHAQSMKPDAQMPDLTQFTGTQLQQLTAYLQQLK
ncbi:MAG TPA: cytochrome c oxidase subunit II [Acidobacteriaceae bacterium]|jgi:cytochrome c oxidase subunit 2|nr:cytochrome c oxidase subunit II [Acidobacteriaceae bacterium]